METTVYQSNISIFHKSLDLLISSILEAMIKKTEKRRIAKSKNAKQYRRLNNHLRRESDRAKELCMEEICEEIMELQEKGTSAQPGSVISCFRHEWEDFS